MASRSQIPETISSQKLIKDLSKEIRNAEKYLISLNPPKPERESKRKKKKPLNKDFVNLDSADGIAENRASLALVERESAREKSKALSPDGVAGNSRPPLKLTLPKPATYPYFRTSSCATSEDAAKQTPHQSTRQTNTVIRFKLGDKELVRSAGDKLDLYGNFSMDHSVQTQKEFTWKQTSVYDFHDGSNESDFGGFTIDEAPKKKKPAGAKPASALKKTRKVGENQLERLASDAPKNGIEELLKASAYTLGTGGQKTEITYVSSRLFLSLNSVCACRVMGVTIGSVTLIGHLVLTSLTSLICAVHIVC